MSAQGACLGVKKSLPSEQNNEVYVATWLKNSSLPPSRERGRGGRERRRERRPAERERRPQQASPPSPKRVSNDPNVFPPTHSTHAQFRARQMNESERRYMDECSSSLRSKEWTLVVLADAKSSQVKSNQSRRIVHWIFWPAP